MCSSAGVFYGDVDGSLFYGGAPYTGASSSFGSSGNPVFLAEDHTAGAQAALKFYKLEFPTYDGGVDPLNWLNHCEQFFRGQRTVALDRTWLASYHLWGTTQTWYYALEQDEVMPAWECFRKLCQLQFGPLVQGARLAELARVLFQSIV